MNAGKGKSQNLTLYMFVYCLHMIVLMLFPTKTVALLVPLSLIFLMLVANPWVIGIGKNKGKNSKKNKG